MQRYLFLSALALMLIRGAHAAEPPKDGVQQQITKLQQTVDELVRTVKSQQQRINELENGKSLPGSATSVTAAPASQPVDQAGYVAPAPTPAPRPSGTYVPDIGVVADVVGTSTEDKADVDGNDRASLRELELVFGHDIDPYARMDAVVTFSDQEDPDIEEANISYWGLPLGIKARLGRMRERIGKASGTHRDALDTVDEPLVVQRYLGSEGLFRTGLELSAFTPLSLDDYTQELIVGVMQGGTSGGDLLADTQRHPTLYAHLPNFYQLSDETSVELGGTYLLGSKLDDSNLDLNAFGIDGTFIDYITPQNKFKLQSEFYLQRRSAGPVAGSNPAETYSADPFGFYVLADYRLAERWGLTARYDFVEPTKEEEGWREAERGAAGAVTFFESEFARWRFEYEYVKLSEGGDDNRFFLQGTFAIGAHKHNLN